MSVHSGDWRAEFTVLRFQAWRLFGTGRVPESFAGSVKPRKTASATANTASKPLAQSAPQPAALQARYFLDDEVRSLDTLDQEAPAYSEAESNPSKLEPNSVNTEPGVLEQQVLLQQLVAKPNKLKPAAASVDTQKQPANPVPAGQVRPAAAITATANVEQLYSKVHDSHFCEDFFAWLSREIKQDSIEFNTPSAIAHTHPDGLLLVSPKVFRVFAETIPGGTVDEGAKSRQPIRLRFSGQTPPCACLPHQKPTRRGRKKPELHGDFANDLQGTTTPATSA